MLPNQPKQHETPKHEYVILFEARNPLAASQWHLWGFGTPAQAEDGSRKKTKDTKKDFPNCSHSSRKDWFFNYVFLFLFFPWGILEIPRVPRGVHTHTLDKSRVQMVLSLFLHL